jgi:hypothetical protein
MFNPPDHGRGPEVAGPARIRHRATARRLRRAAVGSLCAVASSLGLLSVGAMAAHADNPSETPLALENGWTNAPYDNGPAKVEMGGGIVSFSGAIATSGTNPVAFTLPPALRPAYNVFVPVDMCNGTNGRLDISPSGVVTVEAQDWANASCFTSLDGVSFVASDPPYPQLNSLSPENGWTGGPFGTAPPRAIYAGGTVEFQGAMATSGTNPVAFTLPAALRPAYNVYVKVDMCGATNGRLDISPNGDVRVEPEAGVWSNAQCFTSLDGASFIPSDISPYQQPPLLSLQNGWTGGPYGTNLPQAIYVGGTVEFQGAMATSGTNPVAFTLPPALRPQYTRYVPVDMCSGTNGRLDISPSGAVTVEAEGRAWGNAGCFTSLDGVSFIE